MDKKYLKYSIDDFSQDSDFIRWVKRGNNHNKWEIFIKENPGQYENIQSARKIIEALRVKDVIVPEHGMHEVWNNIEHSQRHILKRKIISNFIKYAAVIILTLMVGGTAIFYFSLPENQFANRNPVAADGSNEAKLILPGGKEILLKEKQSELQFDKAGEQIKIDRDSIISFKEKLEENSMVQVVIPYGKRSDIQLSDGTRVVLNAGTQLIFPHRFTGKYRKVQLTGEAYFDVATNKEQPFIVNAGKMDIRVLGTEFNLKNNDSEDELEVVLVEGEVSLAENRLFQLSGKEVKLKPNQKAVYNKKENTTFVESNINTRYYTSWKEGVLEFNKESIINVFSRLSRYYNVRFVTESTVELNRKISGKLDLKDSLEAVMKVISDAAPVTYRIENDVVFVNSRINYLPMR